MATYWTMRGGPAAEPPGTGPEKETTEREELPQNGNIQDDEGGTGGGTAGHRVRKETTEREELPQNGNIQDEEGGGGPAAEPPDTLKGGGEEGQVEN